MGVDPLPGIVNYFLGNDPAKWRSGLTTYAGVVYRDLYPGVDLRYDGTGGQLKGTYTLAPGADPAGIRWRYHGATAVRVDETTGNLLITTQSPISNLQSPSLLQSPGRTSAASACRWPPATPSPPTAALALPWAPTTPPTR